MSLVIIPPVTDDRLILLTNDDGVEAEGLLSLRAALQRLGRVVIVAPHEERSAVSHGLTIHVPLRTLEIGPDCFALTGTPADCVMLGVRKLLPRPPDLVVSGINHGANLGDDILYSGTVAGAREAALRQIPSIAVSLLMDGEDNNFEAAAEFTVRVIEELVEKIEPGGYLNVNIPSGTPTEYRFTRQGSKKVVSHIEEKQDPRGRPYYWIGLDRSEWIVEADTDYQSIHDGLVSVTPLQNDQTDYRTLRRYEE